MLQFYTLWFWDIFMEYKHETLVRNGLKMADPDSFLNWKINTTPKSTIKKQQ